MKNTIYEQHGSPVVFLVCSCSPEQRYLGVFPDCMIIIPRLFPKELDSF